MMKYEDVRWHKKKTPSFNDVSYNFYETCQCVFVFIGNIDASLH